MESSALRKRAAWLHAVATRLPARDVAAMLDRYAEEMIAEAEHAERHGPGIRAFHQHPATRH